MSKKYPLNIYFGPQPDCKSCFYFYYVNNKSNQCLLGKLSNLDLCNDFYLDKRTSEIYILDITEKTLKNVIENLEKLKKEFEVKTKKLLALKEDWDLPGSKGYKRSTIIFALLYLSKIQVLLKEKYGIELPSPMLLPGISGEIDLEWGGYPVILISIPEDPTELLGIYGYNKETDKKILIDCKLFDVDKKLLRWLSKIQWDDY